MTWIKHIVLDIAITVVIAVAVFVDIQWLRWIVAIYSPLMLLLKLGALFAAGAARPTKSNRTTDVPAAVYHVLYAANVALLLYDTWWWVAVVWIAIWVTSIIVEQRLRPSAERSN